MRKRKLLAVLTTMALATAAVPAFAETPDSEVTEEAVETTEAETADDEVAEDTEAVEAVDTTESEVAEEDAESAEAEVAPAPQPTIPPVSEKVRVGYILNDKEEATTHTYTYYVVSHSPQGKSYWATSIDGSKSLWFHAHENKGEYLNVNDNFKATFDKQGRLLSIEKVNL
ncbi:hypothetical protein BEP19_13550 [Ammoniphilus oxalaticus]|uniref:Uncharacterized protein n=1 Tax=Ammoniphilus oxalaticus TaxID=66863 RepID=A0A419SF61_9BACL|nr:hypothetical protein [Ammoniphilus oxalaticus]RKD22089.1 hypothetical protein BEP19_13550 [Ammoniphilus oxalaticus]